MKMKTISFIFLLCFTLTLQAQPFTLNRAALAATKKIPAAGGGLPTPSSDYTNKLAHYWKLQDSPITTMTDEVGSWDMASQYGGTPASISGQIGNGLNLPDSTGTEFTTYGYNDGDGLSSFNGPSVAFRFWIKENIANAFEFSLGQDGFKVKNNGGGGEVTFFVRDDGFSAHQVDNGASLSLNTWHRVWAWYNSTDINLKVDNGTTHTTSFSSSGVSMLVPLFIIGTSGGVVSTTCAFDEVGLWIDYNPSADDMTYDWNNGSGQTNP